MALLGLVLLVVTGCIQPIRAPVDAGTVPPAAVDRTATSSNRLLVLGDDGNIFTIAPDGSARFDLTSDADRRRFYSQPIWSPTGEQVAWAEVNSRPGEAGGALITAGADGSELTRVEVPFPPFYLQWSPDSRHVAYLSNWVEAGARTIALRLVDLAEAQPVATTLGLGQPFYFSWSPDSAQLLTHVNRREIGILALDGSVQALAERSANFATPQWSRDGEQLLFSAFDAETPQLVVADRAGTVQQVVTFFQAQVSTAFSLSPQGDLVAYTETDAPVGANSFGPLFVYHLPSEEFEQLTDEPVIAFFWSPDGTALLYMTAEFADNQPWLRLFVWGGSEKRDLGRFIPSNAFFNQYLPFADQYAYSLHFWSPDSQAIVYAGRAENGDAGIWVRELEKDAPVFVTEGVIATWSPR
jgi:TolB protein